MKLATVTTILALIPATVIAQSRVEAFCGNELDAIVSTYDVTTNPVGYFVKDLGVQLRNEDPRVIRANIDDFLVCTRPAANPAMSATKAILMQNQTTVKYLFIPILRGDAGRGS